MSLLQNSNAIESGGYLIERSLRFQSASSQYLSRTPASASNRKTWTWSCWVKKGAIGAWGTLFNGVQSSLTGYTDGLILADTNTIYLSLTNAALNAEAASLVTTAVYRDPSAWYHIVLAVDTTQATASNRIKLYVNGSQITVFTTANYPAQNFDCTYINSAGNLFQIGRQSSTWYFDGYMTEVNFIDGQALTPSSFGETDALTGVWVAKKYTGTYGTNGFYLKFNDGTSTTTLGQDRSGNANNWTLTNFTRSAGVSDCWMYDVPSGNGSPSATQPSSNYAVMNPLQNAASLTKSNLYVASPTNAIVAYPVNGTMAVTDKVYFETVIETNATGAGFLRPGIGFTKQTNNVAGDVLAGQTANSFGVFPASATSVWYKNTNGGGLVSTGVTITGFANGTVIGIAYDPINGNAWFSKDGVWNGSGNPATGANPDFTGVAGTDYVPQVSAYGYSGTFFYQNVNFGQRSFAYTPPSGFKALCTANLPAPTIAKGNQYMDATLYTGNGTSQSINNAGSFQPDAVWIKARNIVENHVLYNSNVGTSSYLLPNSTVGDQTPVSPNSLTFSSTGFNLPEGGSRVNGNTNTYVAWQWRAGSSTVTNTSGTISSQVRANTTSGFSIVTYTGTGANATVGHGLGVAPKMIICKARGQAENWAVYHASVGNNYALFLNTTAAQTGPSNAYWNNTTPTSTVFSVNTSTTTNAANTMVAYVFAEIAGFSKFGSYTGNGSTDGPFVYCGFRPRFVMVKWAGGVENWAMIDTARSLSNTVSTQLFANLSSADNNDPNQAVDILSNGFKPRGSLALFNQSGQTYIFAAFAENPFNYSNAR